MSRPSVAVVGGGPAGLAAAIAVATAGAETRLYDEQDALGGRLRSRALPVTHPNGETIAAPALLTTLVADATAAGATLSPRSVVWGLFPERTLGVVEHRRSHSIAPDVVILAPGATDRALPFPGASLPGVITGRAMQILLNRHRVRPGRRFAIVGRDGADEIGADIRGAGGEIVVQVAEPDPDAMVAEGADGIRTLTVAGVTHEVDIVVIAAGRQPDIALALMAGCAAAYDPLGDAFLPVRDRDLRTNLPGIIIAGDGAQPGTIEQALAEATLAGVSAAALVGLTSEETLAAARLQVERSRSGHDQHHAVPDRTYVQPVS